MSSERCPTQAAGGRKPRSASEASTNYCLFRCITNLHKVPHLKSNLTNLEEKCVFWSQQRAFQSFPWFVLSLRCPGRSFRGPAWPPRVRTCGVLTGPAGRLRGGIQIAAQKAEAGACSGQSLGSARSAQPPHWQPGCVLPRAHRPSLLDTALHRSPAWLLFLACRWPTAQLLEACFRPSVSESSQATGEE